MKGSKDVLFLILGISLVVWSFYAFLNKPAQEQYQSEATLKIGEKLIKVGIADSDEERVRGLSGRASLETGRGLLFIFQEAAEQGFWMKDMRFPIDIIWIDEHWRVSGIEASVSPASYPEIFYSETPVRYVLELNSGEASRLGIDIGSKLYLIR